MKKKPSKKIKAFGIIGDVSKELYRNSDGTKYLIYSDGFVGENKMYEMRGRGLKVNIETVEITINET